MADRRRSRAKPWSDAELAILADNPGMSTGELTSLLPARSRQAIGNKRHWYGGTLAEEEKVVPISRPAGDYVETLSAYLVDEFDCMEIWLRWNGYSSYRELSRNMQAGMFGIVTILATAK